MPHWCLPTILRGIVIFHLLRLLHRMWLPKIGCRHHHLYISFSPKIQPPFGLFFHSCWIIRWRGVFWYFCCRSWCNFLYWHPPINLTLCGHICHNCCTCPWITFHYCFVSCLWSLMLENSLLDQVSLVSCFCSTMSSRTNKHISWGPWIPFLRCWRWKRLSRVFNLQVKYQRRMPSDHLHLYNIFP